MTKTNVEMLKMLINRKNATKKHDESLSFDHPMYFVDKSNGYV